MDELDVAILRSMGIRPYSPVPRRLDTLRAPELARRLGVAVDTVKARVGRMRDTGVIRGFRALPNLRHLGLSGAAFFFRVAEGKPKERALEGIAAESGILEVHDMLGAGLCIELARPDADAWRGSLARLAARTGDEAPIPFYDLLVPPTGRAASLTHLDWRIVAALRADASSLPAALADVVGVSERTVRRRVDALERAGDVLAAPVLDLSKAEGLILFELLTFFDAGAPPDMPARVLRAFESRSLTFFPPKDARLGQFDLVLCASSVAQVETMRREAAAIEGVARADAWLFQGVLDTSAWVDALIAERIETTATRS